MIFEHFVTQKPRETRVSLFSVGTVKAVYVSTQVPNGLPALNVKANTGYLR